MCQRVDGKSSTDNLLILGGLTDRGTVTTHRIIGKFGGAKSGRGATSVPVKIGMGAE